MFCTKCGKEINPGAKFCSGCGTPVAQAEPVVETPVETPVVEAVEEKAETAAEKVEEAAETVTSSVAESFEEADKTVSTVADKVVSTVSDAVESVEKAVDGVARDVQNSINNNTASTNEAPKYEPVYDNLNGNQQSNTNQQAAPNQGAPYRTDETVVTTSSGQAIKIFAAVAGVILAWGFLRNFFGSVFNLIGLPFKLIFDDFYGSVFSSVFGSALSILQGLSFGLLVIACYFMFKEYKEEKQKDYFQMFLAGGVLAAVIAVVRLIKYIIGMLDYWEYYEVGFGDFWWFLKNLIFAALPFVGFLIICLVFGKKFELVSPGGSLVDETKAAFKDLFARLKEETSTISENLDKKSAERDVAAGVAAQPLSTNYSLLKLILLGLVTCGIYDYYIIYCIARDTNKTCEGDGQKTTGLLLFIIFTWLTCGIYAVVYFYMLGNRQNANATRYGMTFQENGTTVLLWMIFGTWLCGVGFYIAWHIILKNTNALNNAYNNSRFGGPQNPMQGGYTVAQPTNFQQ